MVLQYDKDQQCDTLAFIWNNDSKRNKRMEIEKLLLPMEKLGMLQKKLIM